MFIYAPAAMDGKEAFWAEIISYINLITLPYIVLGDFNELSFDSDKLGGVPSNSKRLNRMNYIKSQLNFYERPFSSQKFTWRKKKKAAQITYILECLDKGLVSIGLLNQFPNAMLKHHIFTSSDHCFVSLSFLPPCFLKAHPSKF